MLDDDETIIFIDTNILATFYKINGTSRDEIFNWLKTIAEKERLKVPNWVVSEYTSRFIRDKIKEFLSPLDKLKAVIAEYKQLQSFLSLHVDDDAVKKSGGMYTNVLDFKSDLAQVYSLFNKMKFLTNSVKDDFIHDVHSKIEILLNECHINSHLDSIFDRIDPGALLRYQHNFPPGFKDSGKGNNDYGDLIIWNEIIAHCKGHEVKKVLILTNDQKKDWVYSPLKVKQGNQTKGNSDPKYKIIDPRLVHEFYNVTTSDEIEILNFEQLGQILIKKFPGNFKELGKALQIIEDIEEGEGVIGTGDLESEIPKLDISSQTVIDKEVAIEHKAVEEVPSSIHGDYFQLDEWAFKDKDIDLSDDQDLLVDAIISLKSYNWYTQNAGLEYFLSRLKTYELNDVKAYSRLFVVGRNIYQSACGGAFTSIDLISEGLGNFIKNHEEKTVNLVIGGMFYEVYFDSNGEFRNSRLKSTYLDSLFDLDKFNSRLPLKKFIQESLKEHEDKLLYVPFEEAKVEVNAKFDKELIEIKDWGESKDLYNNLLELTCSKGNLLTNSPTKGQAYFYDNFSLEGMKKIISDQYGVWKQKLDIKPENFNKEYKIFLYKLFFKKHIGIED